MGRNKKYNKKNVEMKKEPARQRTKRHKDDQEIKGHNFA